MIVNLPAAQRHLIFFGKLCRGLFLAESQLFMRLSEHLAEYFA